MKEWLYNWGGLNEWLFRLINSVRLPFYDEAMLFMSWVSDHEHFKYYVIALAVFYLFQFLWMKIRREPITQEEAKGAGAMLTVMVMGYAAYGMMIGVLKSFCAMPRPFVQYYYTPGAVRFIGTYPPVEDYYASLPSGHAATATFMAAAFWPRLNKTGRYIAVFLAFLACWSRVSVGMHFPADVTAGALIGVAAAILVRRYVYKVLGLER